MRQALHNFEASPLPSTSGPWQRRCLADIVGDALGVEGRGKSVRGGGGRERVLLLKTYSIYTSIYHPHLFVYHTRQFLCLRAREAGADGASGAWSAKDLDPRVLWAASALREACRGHDIGGAQGEAGGGHKISGDGGRRGRASQLFNGLHLPFPLDSFLASELDNKQVRAEGQKTVR